MLYNYDRVQYAIVGEVANEWLYFISLVSFPNDLIVDVEYVDLIFERILILGQNQ
jgi:hypothetical protein